MFGAIRRKLAGRKFAGTRFAPLFEAPHPDEKVSLDCEFTNLNPKRAEIVSIGAVRIRGNRILRSRAFYRKVKTPETLDAQSIKIHGLRPEDLREGEDLKTVLRELLEFIGNRPLVGYCAGLDAEVLNRSLTDCFNLKLPQSWEDVGQMFQSTLGHRWHGSGDLSFDNILAELDIPAHGRHTALGDALVTAVIYLALKNHS